MFESLQLMISSRDQLSTDVLKRLIQALFLFQSRIPSLHCGSNYRDNRMPRSFKLPNSGEELDIEIGHILDTLGNELLDRGVEFDDLRDWAKIPAIIPIEPENRVCKNLNFDTLS